MARAVVRVATSFTHGVCDSSNSNVMRCVVLIFRERGTLPVHGAELGCLATGKMPQERNTASLEVVVGRNLGGSFWEFLSE